MDDGKFKITITLSGEKFALIVNREEEIIYRRAEQMLNKEYLYLASKYGEMSREALFTMLAYEVMVGFQKGSRAADKEEVAKRLTTLSERIDEALTSAK